MKINLFLRNKVIKSGSLAPVSIICEGQQYLQTNAEKVYWANGQANENIKGYDVLITAESYTIGYNHYDLSSGYAIKCKLTDKGTLIPLLRHAKGDEVNAIKKNGIGINPYWPILIRIW